VIACGGIWVGGKGWGLTWKVIQLVVKPQVMESVFGKCHIPIAQQDRDEKPKEKEVVVVEVPKEVAVPVVAKDVAVAVPKKVVVVPAVVPEVVMNTYTNDSDNEEPVTKTKVVQEEEVTVPEVVQEAEEAEAEPEPVVQEAPKKKIVKKIITKKAV
jgi:hypothetical protein